MLHHICALRDLVPFVQFKKREKHPWRSVTFSKVAGFSLQKKLLLKMLFLKISQIHSKTPVPDSLFKKPAIQAPTQVFSYRILRTFSKQDSFFTEHLRVTASVFFLIIDCLVFFYKC